jgi:molybdopterin synthase sulfur carrier subunit
LPRIVLAPALTRWLAPGAPAGVGEVSISTVGVRLDEALDELFAQHPGLRGYVLDERGAIRHHVAIFVDGDAVRGKQQPTQALRKDSEIYVMQALSGG